MLREPSGELRLRAPRCAPACLRAARRRGPGARARSGCRPATLPLRSRISPRGAWILISRMRLFFASARYSSPESTCRNQRRKKTAAKTTSAMPPRIATRSANCGVRRGRVFVGAEHQTLPCPSSSRTCRRARRPACRPRTGRPRRRRGPAARSGGPAGRPGSRGGSPSSALDEDLAEDEDADRRVDAEHQLSGRP